MENAQLLENHLQHLWRRDDEGNPIERAYYENLDTETGWVIDYILPVAKGGTDDLSNLRPPQWRTRFQQR
jgi:hypothetical protein